jgi:hypothetical protein
MFWYYVLSGTMLGCFVLVGVAGIGSHYSLELLAAMYCIVWCFATNFGDVISEKQWKQVDSCLLLSKKKVKFNSCRCLPFKKMSQNT